MKKFPIRHKYKAVPKIADGFRFDSTKEAKYYEQLKHRLQVDVLFFLRQVPFHLPGGVILRIDFQVFYKDESVEFIDVKGFATSEYKAKKRIVEALYPITIREV